MLKHKPQYTYFHEPQKEKFLAILNVNEAHHNFVIQHAEQCLYNEDMIKPYAYKSVQQL